MNSRRVARDWLTSLPNTLYMILVGGVVFLSAFGFSLARMNVEAALTASLGLFFVGIGLVSYGIIVALQWVERRRLSA